MKFKALYAFTMVLLLFFSIITSANSIKINQSDYKSSNFEKFDDIEYYALVIGVEIYQDKNFTDSMHNYADKIDDGAIKMYDLIKRSKNFKEENIKMILNENASSQKIKENITIWLDDKEDKNDVVLIVIAGHAWRMPLANRSEGNAFYFSYDVSTFEYTKNAVTDVELDSWVDTLESQHIVVIFDTCYSGRMLAMRQNCRTILTAGGKYFFCPVDEHYSLGSGIFTYFLIQGFNGVADLNNDGWVTAKEAFFYARKPVIWFSLWAHFPYLQLFSEDLLFVGPQIPYLYDCHIGIIKLYEYNKE